MTLGDDDLPKVTQTAESAGIRVRFPYLDHELAEFSGTLPAALKVRLLEKRYLFKRATRNLLPEAILKKKKHGFGLPIGFWLKSDPHWHAWAKEILYDPRNLSARILPAGNSWSSYFPTCSRMRLHILETCCGCFLCLNCGTVSMLRWQHAARRAISDMAGSPRSAIAMERFTLPQFERHSVSHMAVVRGVVERN